MPNTNQILFIVILVIIFSLLLIGIFYLMNKASNKRRELFDLEQKLQIQEHYNIHQPTIIYKPAATMIKQGHLSPIIPSSSIIIMTPKKEEKVKPTRESILNKVYGFRNVSNSPPPFLPSPQRPSSIRPPSFLPMQEKQRSNSPPAYGDYRNSTPVLTTAATITTTTIIEH